KPGKGTRPAATARDHGRGSGLCCRVAVPPLFGATVDSGGGGARQARTGVGSARTGGAATRNRRRGECGGAEEEDASGESARRSVPGRLGKARNCGACDGRGQPP